MAQGNPKTRKPKGTQAEPPAKKGAQQLSFLSPTGEVSINASPTGMPPTPSPATARASVAPVQVASLRTALTTHEKYIVRVLFKNQILDANASAYEKLFTKIWNYANPSFRQIKPQGKRGDKKNDGYHTDTGEYYQVYAPEKASANVAEAVRKLENDFEGLKAYWDKVCPVRAYRFVFNDKYEGSFPDIESACARLKAAHGLDDCRVVLAADLENTLFDRLTDDQILAVVGSIPGPELLKGIDFRGLKEVIEHLLHRLKPPKITASPLVAPDFEEKLQFNALCTSYASLLRSGNRHSGELDVYFVNQGNFLRDQIHRIFKELYRSARHRIEDGDGALSRSDRIFVDIFQNALPKAQHTVPIENAVFSLMAYYFETCDIFEEPLRRL
jgi:hypothetical protein